jgi:hypothetical protein
MACGCNSGKVPGGAVTSVQAAMALIEAARAINEQEAMVASAQNAVGNASSSDSFSTSVPSGSH